MPYFSEGYEILGPEMGVAIMASKTRREELLQFSEKASNRVKLEIAKGIRQGILDPTAGEKLGEEHSFWKKIAKVCGIS